MVVRGDFSRFALRPNPQDLGEDKYDLKPGDFCHRELVQSVVC
jgi:hypothetical protein